MERKTAYGALTRRRFGASLVVLATGVSAAPLIAATRASVSRTAQASSLRLQVAQLLARMTLREKTAQLVGVWQGKAKLQDQRGLFSAAAARQSYPDGLGQISRPGDRIGLLAANKPINAGAEAGVVNRGPREGATWARDAQRWARSTRLGIPLLLHEEGLHGFVAREATSFPQAIALASTWDPELVERCFAISAREMRARGVNLALAPVVDVARDPRWGRFEETFGEDPHLVAEMGLAAVRGMQGTKLPLRPDKVFATLKHLAGHGSPENGTNVGPAVMSERLLREVVLHPFERIVRELPVRAVMPSYNEIDGVPSHANRWLLTEVLRDEWGFEGIAVSDYFGVRQLVERHKVVADLNAAAALALEAGVDVELPDPIAYRNLEKLVRSGDVSMDILDRAVSRVLSMKIEGGLFEAAEVAPAAAEGATANQEAISLARAAASRAMVLLTNDGVLPLDPTRARRLLVVGTHARDTPIGGYSDTPRRVVSVLDGLRTAAGDRFVVDWAEGIRLTRSRIWEQDKVEAIRPEENAPLMAAAVEAANHADVIVLVLGENEQLSREAWAETHLGDRDDLELFGQQDELASALFATGKPVVVLLLNGRPLAVNLLAKQAKALIEGWYLGQETGHAVADVLLGRVSPGGKLPVSIPRSVGQLPIFYNQKPSARRGYLFGDTKPLFPFGFGLSYTRFSISAPHLSKDVIGAGETVQVTVEVRNVGAHAGDEVVQLYIRDEVSSVTRPLLELKAFRRLTLEPGTSQFVTFAVGPEQLSFWNVAMKRVVEAGTFLIMTGPNSVDLQSVRLTVTA